MKTFTEQNKSELLANLESLCDDPPVWEELWGIPQVFCRIFFLIKEKLPMADSKKWPERFFKSVPAGVNLLSAPWKLAAWLVRDSNPGKKLDIIHKLEALGRGEKIEIRDLEKIYKSLETELKHAKPSPVTDLHKLNADRSGIVIAGLAINAALADASFFSVVTPKWHRQVKFSFPASGYIWEAAWKAADAAAWRSIIGIGNSGNQARAASDDYWRRFSAFVIEILRKVK